MSGHENGNGMGNGNGIENGDGTGKKLWNLAEDGMLWKTALDYATEDFQAQARAFVAHLQESLQPADALQGLLLDRIAAGYLRKQLVLEAEAAARKLMKQNKAEECSGYSPEAKRMISDAHSQHLWFRNGELLRYEALLDQALHRDLILLQQLKKAALAAQVLSAQKPQLPNRHLIESAAADSNVACPAHE